MVGGGPFNPLDRMNLGKSVAEAMLEQKPHPLGKLAKLTGAGIYAIYYIGDFPAYRILARQNTEERFKRPIYVGKAVPAGARKGGASADPDAEYPLYGRLREHAKSVQQANNLKIEDFMCRYLVVEDIWIPLGESLLIGRFSPVWNTLLDGFGNHNPGKGRYEGMVPRWDVLHPGRPWAPKFAPRPETAAQIASEVENYLRIMPEPSPHMLDDTNDGGSN